MKYFGASRAQSHIIALTEGEEIIQTMIDFCAAKGIKAGFSRALARSPRQLSPNTTLKPNGILPKFLTSL